MQARGGRERRLLAQFRALAEREQQTLLDFAEFLAQRGAAPAELSEPRVIPRPKRESVVKAIKRLSETYPMLDKAEMLNQTSVLMGQHIMHGRAAAEVIDELEALPFVGRVESLFSVPHLKTVDGYLDKEPYLATLPDSPAASRRLLDQALTSLSYGGIAVNTMPPFVFLSPYLTWGGNEKPRGIPTSGTAPSRRDTRPNLRRAMPRDGDRRARRPRRASAWASSSTHLPSAAPLC